MAPITGAQGGAGLWGSPQKFPRSSIPSSFPPFLDLRKGGSIWPHLIHRDPAPLGSLSFLPKGSPCCHTTAWRVCSSL